MFTYRAAVVLVSTFALSACGIGAGVQANRVSMPDGGNSANLMAKSITVWDSTGGLAAGLGTVGNRYTAEKAARAQAIKDGKKPGDSYEYEYAVVPPAPGYWASYTFSWGSGTGTDDRDVSFWQFDMRAQMLDWQVGPVSVSFLLGFTFGMYNQLGDNPHLDEHEDVMVTCMPTGLVGAYKVGPKGTLTGRAALDPLISGIMLAAGETWFMYELGARFDYRVLKSVNVYVDAASRRSAMDGYIDEKIVSAGLGYIWGEHLMRK